MRFLLIVALAVFLIPLAHADVGPSPQPPLVTVRMYTNGTPDARVTEITYHCMGSESSDDGAVTQRLMTIPCSDGVCSNNGTAWFYKFNPCFTFPPGYFSYEVDGSSVASESFNLSENQTAYDISIDSDTGVITSQFGSTLPSGCCLPGLVLPGIVAGAVFFGRKGWTS